MGRAVSLTVWPQRLSLLRAPGRHQHRPGLHAAVWGRQTDGGAQRAEADARGHSDVGHGAAFTALWQCGRRPFGDDPATVWGMWQRGVRAATPVLTMVASLLLVAVGALGVAQVHTAVAAPTRAVPRGAGQDGPGVSKPASAARVATPRPQLVVLGDSVAAGSMCACSGFAGALAADAAGSLVNAALPGLTSQGLLTQLRSPSLVAALQTATVVTVTIGANDFDETAAGRSACATLSCYADPLQSLRTNLAALASRLTTLTRPATTIVLMGYWNVFLDGEVGDSKGATYVATSDSLTRSVNTAIGEVANAHRDLYADLYGPFKSAASSDDTQLLAADGDHPNAAGQQIIATAIERTIGDAAKAPGR